MIEPGTVILTSTRPGFQEAVAQCLPGLCTIEALRDPPETQIKGRVWCFVDWLLSDISGLEMCRRLRSAPATAQSHITMVLDDDDSEARRRALRAGADDYVLGPLTSELLLNRLQAYQSGVSASKPQPKLGHGELTLDLAAHTARWRGTPLPLRPNEFRLLIHFIEHPNQVFSRTSLIAILGKEGEAIDERTVDVWVGRLRRALMAHGVPDPLRTVRSMGYVLDSI
jgi:two-component system, OmpR family, phosphate regulon response regulator PhoB